MTQTTPDEAPTFLRPNPNPADAPGNDYWRVERPYTTAEEGRLRRAIEKVFPRHDAIKAGDPLPEHVVVIDPAHVMLVYAKTERARGALAPFIAPEGVRTFNIPLQWRVGAVAGCFYSTDMLARATAIVEAGSPPHRRRSGDTGVFLTMAADTPLQLESADFRVLIAPRIYTK